MRPTNEQPLVSVLTPSFNQARWLPDNLRSVAGQSYPRIEHVVMDGASTDGSVETLASASHDLRWWSEADRGQSHALNKAFAESSGEIIGWLNSDDAYFSRDAVAEVVNLFSRRPDVSVVYGHAALTNDEGLILHAVWVPQFHYRLLRLHNFIIQPAVFVRRSAILKGFIDEQYEYCMDQELWLRLAQTCRFSRINKVLAIDRHYADRKSSARLDLAVVDWRRLERDYKISRDPLRRAKLKMLKILFRIVGVRLVGQLRGELAFGGSVDGSARLIRRQIARRRISME